MQRITIPSVAALAVLAAAVAAPARGQSPVPPPDLDAYVDSVMRAFEVPGVAVAIVKDGQVVLAKGFGKERLPLTGMPK